MLIGSWKGKKLLKVGIFLNKNLLGSDNRKLTAFLGLLPAADKNVLTKLVISL